jgi:uncharacterized protein YggE
VFLANWHVLFYVDNSVIHDFRTGTMKKFVLIALVLLPSAVAAQDPRQPAERTISVTGTGTVSREPDQAAISIAVESVAATARLAAQENANKMDALVAALKRAGLPAEDIRTISYQLEPQYIYPQGEDRTPPRIANYRAMNMVQVTVDTVARTGRIIDAAVASGANRVTGINFQLKNSEAARLDAVRNAIARARAEAEAIASALGERLGPALHVGQVSEIMPPRPRMAMEMAMVKQQSAPTPIEPGQLEITANVTVVYRIDPR